MPAIQSISPTVAVVGTTLTYDVDAIDADSTTLIYSLDTVPTGMTITTCTGEITWTPSVNQAGDHTVVVAVSDGANRTTQRFTLSVFGVQQAASVPISAATGGTVTVNNPNSAINGLSIDIPPNALSRDETIRVSELINPPTVGGVQPVLLRGFNLEPDGIIFNSPVTITIPYNPNLLQVGAKTTTAHSLGVFFLDPATGQKVFLDNFAVDTVRNVVTGTINHFSSYALTNIAAFILHITGRAAYLPVILLHGFLGDETSFGQLHNLLIGAGITTYVFILDSTNTTFIETATKLADFIETVKAETRQSKVNIIAHSFGGILARTYLQDMAGPRYRNDVNKLMTIGTPHRGIGGRFSLLEANFCARTQVTVACIEAATGIGDGQGLSGNMLRTLNNRSLPRLESLATPQ